MTASAHELCLLRTFLESKGDFVSGARLAELLGVSRNRVSSWIEGLEAAGFEFEMVRNRGYRLLREPSTLHGALLDASLTVRGGNVPVHLYAEIDSTNTQAERLLSEGVEAPCAVLAHRQTAGRGRLGRLWQSQTALNFYGSLAFRPQLPPGRMTHFTLWMGVSLCHLLDEGWGVPAQIKWPNDLLCGGKKMAGMLTEARIERDLTRDIIFGVGLNVNGSAETFPIEVRGIATSICQVLGKEVSLNALAADVIACLVTAYEAFVDGSYELQFKKYWIDYDCLNGKTIQARTPSGVVTGIVAGLNADGSLALVTEDGTRTAIRAGDVSIGSGVHSTP